MRAWFAICALAVLALSAANFVDLARRVRPPPRVARAEEMNLVMRHEQRFAAVRAALARAGAVGPIGYIADVPGAELAAHPRGTEEYFLTQFALVPWVLDAREERRWSVTNLRARSLAERLPAGIRVVEDFGGGVYLIERNAP
jgi:hypothetical protein